MSDDTLGEDAPDDGTLAQNEHAKRASQLAKDLFDKLSDFINEHSAPWMSVDAEAEPARAALEKHLWSKALLCALARQLGIVEAALIIGDQLPDDEVQRVREAFICAGRRVCMDVLEAQKAEEREN